MGGTQGVDGSVGAGRPEVVEQTPGLVQGLGQIADPLSVLTADVLPNLLDPPHPARGIDGRRSRRRRRGLGRGRGPGSRSGGGRGRRRGGKGAGRRGGRGSGTGRRRRHGRSPGGGRRGGRAGRGRGGRRWGRDGGDRGGRWGRAGAEGLGDRDDRGDRSATVDHDGDLAGQPGHPDQLLETQASLSDGELDPAANRSCWFSHTAMMRRGYDKNAWGGRHRTDRFRP